MIHNLRHLCASDLTCIAPLPWHESEVNSENIRMPSELIGESCGSDSVALKDPWVPACLGHKLLLQQTFAKILAVHGQTT